MARTWPCPFTTILGMVLSLTLTPPAVAQGLRLLATIEVPGAPLESFDISWVDPATHTYYLADRSNGGVDVIDTRAHRFVRRIGGVVGGRGEKAGAGPGGMGLGPQRHQVWGGGGGSPG